MTTISRILSVVLASVGWFVPSASAQPMGTYRWQLQPYCNIVTLAVTQQGSQYQLDGTDDLCGAVQQGSVRGMAYQNPNGTIGLGFTVVTAPNGTPVHVSATVTLATVSGSWTDSAGNAGAFTFTPAAGTAGGVRPVPAGGLAPGSVTTVQLAPSVFGGTGAASTVARSDHEHDARYYTKAAADARYVPLPTTQLVVNTAGMRAPTGTGWAITFVWVHTASAGLECIAGPLDVPVGRSLGAVTVSYAAASATTVSAALVGIRNSPGSETGVLVSAPTSSVAAPPTAASTVGSVLLPFASAPVGLADHTYSLWLCTAGAFTLTGLKVPLSE